MIGSHLYNSQMKWSMSAENLAETLRVREDSEEDRQIDDRIWRWVNDQKLNPRAPGWQYDLHAPPRFTGSLDAACALIPVIDSSDGPQRIDFILEHVNGGMTIGARVGTEDTNLMVFGSNDAQAVARAALEAHIRLGIDGVKSLPLMSMQALMTD